MPQQPYQYRPRNQSNVMHPAVSTGASLSSPIIRPYHGNRNRPRVFHGDRSRAIGMELETHHDSPRNFGLMSERLRVITAEYRERFHDQLQDAQGIYFSDQAYEQDFQCEQDGSITGVEFIFQPRDYQSWKEYFSDDGPGAWLIGKLNAAGFHCKYNSTDYRGSTGNHIHVTREWITTEIANASMRIAREMSETEILRLTQRSSMHSIHQWASFNDTRDRDRCAWVNQCPRSTMEFRGFRSQLRADRILAKIAFVADSVHLLSERPNLPWPELKELIMIESDEFRNLMNTPRPRETQ